MSNILYVGIDISKNTNVVHIMLPNGKKYEEFSVDNSLYGARLISKSVVKVLKHKKIKCTYFGLEATSIYGKNLIYFLNEDDDLKSFDHKVFELNPLQVTKFKESYSDLPKNDYVDAFIIADCLRFGRINKSAYTTDYKYDALKQLTRARFSLIQLLVKEKISFLNHLFLKYSSLTQTKVFSNTFSATAMSIYNDFDSVDTLALMDLHELTNHINKIGKNRFANPDELSNAIKKAVRSSYRLPQTVNDSNNQVLAISKSTIDTLESQVDILDKQIAKLIEVIPNTLRTIKGIGPVYQAGIIAEIGDIDKFDNQASLAKYAGLAWSEYQSGNFKSEHTHLIHSGNKYLKYYLIQAAFSLLRCDKEFKRFYTIKYNQVKKGKHKRALALTARKFVRVVFHLLKNKQIYIPRK